MRNNRKKSNLRDNTSFKKKKIRRIILIILLIITVVVLSIGFYIWYSANKIVSNFSSGDKKEVVEKVKPELNKKPKKEFKGKIKKAETYLLIGSDVRPSESGNGRSDTIMLVRVYPKTNQVSILSLPRDLYVNIPGYGKTKINAAYSYGGVALMTATIREWLGIPIDHFFQVSFESFAGIVDKLGGAYLPVDQRYYHVNDGTVANNWASIDLKPGYQKLNGEDTLSFVRFRHLDSDFYRASRQQLFVREIGRQIRTKTDDPFVMKSIIEDISKGTTSDMDKLSPILRLANTLRRIPADNIVRIVMPGEGAMINGASVLLTSEWDKKNAIKEWASPGSSLKKQKRKPSLTKAANNSRNISNTAWDIVQQLLSSGSLLDYRLSEEAKKKELLTLAKEIEGKEFRIEKSKTKKANLVKVSPPESLGNIKSISHCTPNKLPQGFYWPSEGSIHKYDLNGHRALATYATKGSGVSILWMWTEWQNPPILETPSDAVMINNRKYNLYWEKDTLRMIAWDKNGVKSWITNTLQNDLNKEEMIALAESCSS